MQASRREFLYGLGIISASSLFAMERSEPDVILYNGNFWTVNPHQPRAQAVAISNSRFLAIGSNDEILPLAAGNAKKIDLGGKTVLPGFIDAHSHPAEAGLSSANALPKRRRVSGFSASSTTTRKLRRAVPLHARSWTPLFRGTRYSCAIVADIPPG